MGGDFESFPRHWPIKWFGWKDHSEQVSPLPVFHDVVDREWHPEDLDSILDYLDNADRLIVADCPPQYCKYCGATLQNPTMQISDSVWTWSAALSHYVKDHSVRLPDPMVDHIRLMTSRAKNQARPVPK